MKHQPGDVCNYCEKLLIDVHPELGLFFHWAKSQHKQLHISDGWRGEDAQNKAFERGASRARWPNSKHNYMINGKPCSLAIDLFEIDDTGHGVWDSTFFQKLYNQAKDHNFFIGWGGNFKKIHDSPHFELIVANKHTNLA